MSSKSNPEPSTTATKKSDKPGSFVCGVRGPGPKYLLRTVVGYNEHCLSKYRYPAYTFGSRQPAQKICGGPGPKYLLVEPKRGGFSFGLVRKVFDPFCGPGPKYLLPVPKAPAFTIKSRTNQRKTSVAPGPYSVKRPIGGPAFYIGIRTPALKCFGTPGPRAHSVDMVKQKPPIYSLGLRLGMKERCRSPGPKYYPQLDKPIPQYSFGTKHSECAPPYIVECDDKC